MLLCRKQPVAVKRKQRGMSVSLISFLRTKKIEQRAGLMAPNFFTLTVPNL